MKQKTEIITKISSPRLYSVFNRTRLFDRIDQCRRQHPVTWVSGLPGSGKTTLAASYIEAQQISAIWYQMDSTDTDPANFFYYMTEAVKKKAGCGKITLPRLSPEHFLNLSCYSVKYFRELFSLLQEPAVIILDNYHEVSSDSDLHEFINAGLEQVPSGLNIIVLSRTAPPPAMARLLVNRKIVEIQAEELSLTEDESNGIAALHDNWKSNLESVPAIREYTGGWTAGFVIMLEYGNPDRGTDLTRKEMAREFFFNYFAGEIFNKMEPDIQSFLLKVACLPSFTPEAALELTGFAGAGHILADMHKKNYFTEKKIEEGTSFEFHPLFREFLLARAAERTGPEELLALWRRAGDILVEQGQPEDASLLYAKCGDHGTQADLIRDHAQSFIAQGRLQIVEQWLRELPPARLSADPWLLFHYGQCRLPFNPMESRDFYARAHDIFREQDDETGLILSITGTIETILTEWGDFKQMDPWIAELNNLIKGEITELTGEVENRAVVAMFAALMFRQPHHPDMKLWEERTFALLRSNMDSSLRLLAGGYLSHYSYWKGDVVQAGVVIDIMEELLKTADLSPLAFMTVKMQKAVHGWFSADLKGCLEAMDQGLEEARKSGIHLVDNWLLAQGVYAMLSLDDSAKAKPLLFRMKPILNSQRYLDISHYYYLSSMYYLHNGDMERALRCIEDSLEITREMGAPFPEGLNSVTAAQIYFERGDAEKARHMNERAMAIGRDMQSHLLRMLSLLNEAYFSLKTGRREYAREVLRQALGIRKDTGMINFSGWHPSIMKELYAEALRAGIEPDFVQESIRARNMHPEESAVAITDWPWRIKLYTLGRFETVIDGKPLRFTGKPPLKPLELLKALIALGGKEIGLFRLENLLWPETEGDKARQALVTTLHRLRKLLGYEKAVELREMKLSLNNRYCWVDAWAVDILCKHIDEVLSGEGFDREGLSRLTEKLLAIYKGDFLENEDACSWALPARARLRSKFLQAVVSLAQVWENRADYETAVALYQQGLEADEIAEEFYLGLMRCYLAQGRMAQGLAAYERCREVLSSTLQIVPSPEAESLHQALRRGRRNNFSSESQA